jgi:DNA polymerase (family X)
MRNQQISDLFDAMADIMEILGEDRFRINSYRKVARVIGECAEDVASLAAAGRLQELPGVGKSSAEKINEFVNLGSIRAYQDLLKQIPAGLPELLKIPGFGPKGAAAVWKKLGVTNIADLRRVIEEHRLEKLEGFGEKKAALIARGIEFIESGRGRILLHHAWELAERIMEQLRDTAGKSALRSAGSLRRWCETVGDIDILAEGGGTKIVERFTGLAGVQQVLAAGETKAAVRYSDPEVCSDVVQVDLRIIPAESVGAARQYFTGSKAHNIRLREIAVKKKLKLNEYGLFRGDKPIAGATEEEIYKSLGVAWMPPELREDRGEIEAGLKNQLPELLERADLRGDLHTHSPSSDGRNTIEEMAAAAIKLGYKYLAVTDHSPSSVIANGLKADRLMKQIDKIRQLNKTLKDFTLLAGSEVDILMDGTLDYPDKVLAELDFVVASVHSGLKGAKDKNTARILTAMENPYVNAIGHLTGRMLGVREPMELDMEAILRQAVKTETALEVSASPLRLDLKDVHCRMAVAAGVKLVINTDAHDTDGLEQIRYGVATARRGWSKREDVLNCQSVSKIRQWVKDKRK